jgi:hypothetical protein
MGDLRNVRCGSRGALLAEVAFAPIPAKPLRSLLLQSGQTKRFDRSVRANNERVSEPEWERLHNRVFLFIVR